MLAIYGFHSENIFWKKNIKKRLQIGTILFPCKKNKIVEKNQKKIPKEKIVIIAEFIRYIKVWCGCIPKANL